MVSCKYEAYKLIINERLQIKQIELKLVKIVKCIFITTKITLAEARKEIC